MLTAGVDLATQSAKTAVAKVLWSHSEAQVVELETHGTDATFLAACQSVDFVGIDAPFGWPDAFTAFVDRHLRNTQTVEDGMTDDSRRDMAFRLTDHIVAKEFCRGVPGSCAKSLGASSIVLQGREQRPPARPRRYTS